LGFSSEKFKKRYPGRAWGKCAKVTSLSSGTFASGGENPRSLRISTDASFSIRPFYPQISLKNQSFFSFAAYQEPAHSARIQRILAIPAKRVQKTLVTFLTRSEIDALLAAPDQSKWGGRRDYAFMLVAVQTGLRLSEMTGLRRQDVQMGTRAYVQCLGKGRKERCTPLAKQSVKVLKAWLREPARFGSDILFPNTQGGRLSADGVEYMVAKYVAMVRQRCPSLRQKNVTPHVFRHSAAMELRASGVDLSTIAFWLGHESVETTQIYLDADLALKEKALAKTRPINGKAGRYKPPDSILSFLKSL
jgi:integrase/recombinase XerD